MKKTVKGDLVLIFITLCWGITFPLIENAVDLVDPSVFVSVRFFCAAIFLLPFIFPEFSKHLKTTLFSGVLLGGMNSVTYLTQTIGLETINAAEAAFITGISVIMVPFILPFFRLGHPTIKDIIGSLFCLLGLFFLMGGNFSHISTGHLWVLLCAVSNALAIVYLQKSTKVAISFSGLAFYQILFTAFFSLPFTIGKSFEPLTNTYVLSALVFCAFFATALAIYLQTKFQHRTTAHRAAMIYCFEPIFAALSGYFINEERLGWPVFLGGTSIFIGLMVSMLRRS